MSIKVLLPGIKTYDTGTSFEAKEMTKSKVSFMDIRLLEPTRSLNALVFNWIWLCKNHLNASKSTFWNLHWKDLKIQNNYFVLMAPREQIHCYLGHATFGIDVTWSWRREIKRKRRFLWLSRIVETQRGQSSWLHMTTSRARRLNFMRLFLSQSVKPGSWRSTAVWRVTFSLE